MKYQITCDYCGESQDYNEDKERLETCSNCNSSFEHPPSESIEVETSDSVDTYTEIQTVGRLDGFSLTYKTTGVKIDIQHANMITIGRTNSGAEILSKIPQISRNHCTIEYRDDRYLISDSDSLNGTFIGTMRVDCKRSPGQVLEDKTQLFLGQEPFLIELKYTQEEQIDHEDAIVKTPRFRCKQCGNDFEERDDICPSCGSFDSMETA